MTKRSKDRRVAFLVGVAVVASLLAIGLLYRRKIRAWYEFVTRFERLPDNEQGYPEYRHRQTGIVFVKVPGGVFLMGATEEDPDAHDRARPTHEVSLSPFLIAKYEVTQLEWKRIMGENPSWMSPGGNGHSTLTPELLKDDRYLTVLPVDSVSWKDCMDFCERTGLTLPSEAQWEYACRAGTTGPYSGTGKLDDMGWYNLEIGETEPVGLKHANGFGLYDMHGNVWELCLDAFDEEFYRKPEATHRDPANRSESDLHVIRGGSHSSDVSDCRSYLRWKAGPEGIYGIGFRAAFEFR